MGRRRRECLCSPTSVKICRGYSGPDRVNVPCERGILHLSEFHHVTSIKEEHDGHGSSCYECDNSPWRQFQKATKVRSSSEVRRHLETCENPSCLCKEASTRAALERLIARKSGARVEIRDQIRTSAADLELTIAWSPDKRILQVYSGWVWSESDCRIIAQHFVGESVKDQLQRANEWIERVTSKIQSKQRKR